MAEPVDDRLSVVSGEVVIDVSLSAQLQGYRLAAVIERETVAEGLPKPFPNQREALVERLSAGVGRQHARLGAEVACQWLEHRPCRRGGIEMFHRIEIAMQVEHEVGMAGQPLQGQSHRLQRRRRRHCIERGLEPVADQVAIVGDVVVQRGVQTIGDLVATLA